MKIFTPITTDDFTRVNSDVNGNPRYVIHYTVFDRSDCVDIFEAYQWTLNKAKEILKGSRKFHNKQFGGGIVVSSYNLNDEVDAINLYNIGFIIDELLSGTDDEVVDGKRINRDMYELTVTDKHNALNNDNVRIYIPVESENHNQEIINQLQIKGLLKGLTL